MEGHLPSNTPLKVLLGASLCLLILLTVSGNVLVCVAVCATRRLRCLTNCFIVSLAVTDLLLGLLVLPFSALQQLTDEWPLGPVFCNIYISLDIMLCTASILTLLAISMDRFLAVTMPLRYAALVLPGRVAVAMASVWTVSLAVSFLPIHMGWNTPNGTVQNRRAGDDQRACNFELNGAYALTDSLITFFLPLLVMCCTYYRILRIARSQAKRIIGSRPACVVTSYDAGGNGRCTTTTVTSSVTAVALREHKATVTLAAVIGAFTVCWLPYFILFNVAGVKEQVLSGTLYEVVLWLGYANSALNPILYAALNRDFRSAYARLLGCRWPKYREAWSRNQCPLAAGNELTEVTLLCGHNSANCSAGVAEEPHALEEVNNRPIDNQLTNGFTPTDVNGNERS
ncbi:histamine receptor H2a [Gadus morhua]|uniref:G-protein coupled receptors family 1 profile domain-containing protein n=1 Tax=Gadus morhua TaxID=8049 RepID=A0A8C5B9G6_GADMO|nr:histamine H2 receptor-like [Gadus morhua]XP_030225012.1 histamine H2 receptor-like [Gadus morhua]